MGWSLLIAPIILYFIVSVFEAWHKNKSKVKAMRRGAKSIQTFELDSNISNHVVSQKIMI